MVKDVAALAKITLTTDEEATYETQFSGILETMETLSELETDNVLPTSQVNGLHNIWRDDSVVESFDQSVVINMAPEHENGFIKVEKKI